MNLYKGIFNWYGEIHILYTEANCQNRAFGNLIMQLSKKLKRTRRSVMFYFEDEKKNNWSLKEVK